MNQAGEHLDGESGHLASAERVVMANLQAFRDFTDDCRGVTMTGLNRLAHAQRVTMVRNQNIVM